MNGALRAGPSGEGAFFWVFKNILKKLQESVDDKFRTAIKAPMKRLQAVTTAWSFPEKKGEISSPKTDQTSIESNPMKKFLITAAIVISCAFTVVPRASAQFSWTGAPVSPIQIGDTFVLNLSYTFTVGTGGLPNFAGYSLWLANTGTAGFSLTARSIGASLFGDLQTTNFNLFGGAMGGGIPNILDPINRQGFAPPNNQVNTDIGALVTNAPVVSGTYFLCSLTFVATGVGTSTIGNTTASTPNVGGRITVINDASGNTFNVPFASAGTITVVPEPSSIALLCVGLMSAGVVAYRRRAAR